MVTLGLVWTAILGAVYVQAYGFNPPGDRRADVFKSPQSTSNPRKDLRRAQGGGATNFVRHIATQSSGLNQTRNLGQRSINSSSIPLCGAGRRITCIVDGDTGWEGGRKWRLIRVDTPEISNPECRAEYAKAVAARDRLVSLMRKGYRIVWSGRNDRYGRALVDIELSSGDSAAQVLLNEGLAQGWPNTGNVWCGR
jgi:endonuclease YncB( thermonuclease family)